MAHPLVVHCNKKPYDVYVGRGYCPHTGQWGKWGNPFVVGRDGARGECVELHKLKVLSDPALIARIKKELKGQVLGCWCAPKSCHGDVLAEIANG